MSDRFSQVTRKSNHTMSCTHARTSVRMHAHLSIYKTPFFIFVKSCLKMTGKAEPDRIPSPSTVAYMKIKRLCLVKKQLQEELPEKILCIPAKMIWGYSVGMEKVFFLMLCEMTTISEQNTLDAQ